MICPICEQNLEIIEREVDVFEDDSFGIAKYAVCRDCRKQWKLKNTTASNKKKAPSTVGDYNQIRVVGEDEQAAPPDLASLVNAAKASQRSPFEENFPEKVRDREPDIEGLIRDDSSNPAKATARSKGNDRPGRRRGVPLSEENRPGNRQRKTSRDSEDKPRGKRRHSSRAREDEPKGQPRHPSRARDGRPKDKQGHPSKSGIDSSKGKQRHPSKSGIDSSKGKQGHPSRIGADGSRAKQKHPSRTDDRKAIKNNTNQPLAAIFKPVRIGLAILSLLAFLYLSVQGYLTYYLDYVRFRGAIPISMTVAVFALGLFCLVAGVFLIITLKKDGMLPFIVPSFLYLVGGVIAFFFRADSTLLLSGAILALIVAIVLIILVLIDKIKNVEEE